MSWTIHGYQSTVRGVFPGLYPSYWVYPVAKHRVLTCDMVQAKALPLNIVDTLKPVAHNHYLTFLIPFFNLLASLSPISSLYTSSAVSPFLFLSFLSDFTLTVTSFAPPLA